VRRDALKALGRVVRKKDAVSISLVTSCAADVDVEVRREAVRSLKMIVEEPANLVMTPRGAVPRSLLRTS